jgi:hypothetical protein
MGPITFFHLLERYGSAAAVLEGLPAPDIDDIQRAIEAIAKLGATHLPLASLTIPPASRAV